MLKQLDVMLLFRKLYTLEKGMNLLLSKSQMRGLMLQSELNVPQAKEIRKLYSLKMSVAKLAKHKLQKKRGCNSNGSEKGDGGGSSLAKIGFSEEIKDNFKPNYDLD